MRLVEWEKIIPPQFGAKIVFSSLAYPPHVNRLSADVCGIELPGKMFVDVEWVCKLNAYVVALHREDFGPAVEEIRSATAYEVIDAVLRMVQFAFERELLGDQSLESETHEIEFRWPGTTVEYAELVTNA